VPGTTPRYSIPYAVLGDQPHGPNQEKAIAESVEAALGTVDDYAHQKAPTSLEAAASSDATITTSVADIPGATLTFTTSTVNAVAVVTAIYDWRLTATGTGYCYGEVTVDGVLDSRKALFVSQSAETRLPGIVRKRFVLASAGSHTIKLQCHKDSSGGTALMCGSTTVLSVDLAQ